MALFPPILTAIFGLNIGLAKGQTAVDKIISFIARQITE